MMNVFSTLWIATNRMALLGTAHYSRGVWANMRSMTFFAVHLLGRQADVSLHWAQKTKLGPKNEAGPKKRSWAQKTKLGPKNEAGPKNTKLGPRTRNRPRVVAHHYAREF